MPDPQLENLSRDQWQSATAEFLDHNFQNTWTYSQALALRRGAACEYVGLRSGTEWLALACVRIKRMPVVGGGLAYIAGGPLVRRKADPSGTASLFQMLKALTAEFALRRGMVLRLLPPIGNSSLNVSTTELYAQAGFIPTAAASGYRTFLVNIDRTPKDIRAALQQKWRNGLNGAEKKPHKIITGTSPDLFDRFCELFARFNERKGFHVDLDPAFYRSLQPDLAEPERFTVSLVEVPNEQSPNGPPLTVAGHVSSSLGDTCVYLLGATDEIGLKSKAAYLLQWNAIRVAREKGCMFYDLGGIDPAENPTVHHFKSGLSGVDISAPGPFEYSHHSWRSHVTLRAEKWYRSLGRAKSSRKSTA